MKKLPGGYGEAEEEHKDGIHEKKMTKSKLKKNKNRTKRTPTF